MLDLYSIAIPSLSGCKPSSMVSFAKPKYFCVEERDCFAVVRLVTCRRLEIINLVSRECK